MGPPLKAPISFYAHNWFRKESRYIISVYLLIFGFGLYDDINDRRVIIQVKMRAEDLQLLIWVKNAIDRKIMIENP
jgi:hypothetical protein